MKKNLNSFKQYYDGGLSALDHEGLSAYWECSKWQNEAYSHIAISQYYDGSLSTLDHEGLSACWECSKWQNEA